jgi:hypothetical protein
MVEFKLIFDECLSAPILESLKSFLQTAGVSLTFKGIVEHQRSGVTDKDWIPKIALEGGWVVISSDRGKRRGGEPPDEKLPFLCRKFRVTHVLLSGSIHSEKAFVKGQAIVAVWRELLTVTSATRGTRFQIKKNSSGTGYFLYNEDAKERVKVDSPKG